jgi:hypothetical protein
MNNYIKKHSKSRVMHTIVVHCSATVEGKNFNSKDIKQWHLQRGFNDLGYHFVILLAGTIEIGRPLNKIGAHVSGHNTGTIGICYIGGLDTNNKAKDTRTDAQKESLKKLINALKENISIREIKGHRDYSKDFNGNGKIDKDEWIKACPCFNVKDEYTI